MIRSESPTRRETATVYRRRALVVELHPGYLTIRPKGLRRAAVLDYGAAYECAMRIEARAARAIAAEHSAS